MRVTIENLEANALPPELRKKLGLSSDQVVDLTVEVSTKTKKKNWKEVAARHADSWGEPGEAEALIELLRAERDKNVFSEPPEL